METHAGITEPGPTVYRVTFAHEHNTLKEGDLVRVTEDPRVAPERWLSKCSDGSLHFLTGRDDQFVHLVELSKLGGCVKAPQAFSVGESVGKALYQDILQDAGATDSFNPTSTVELEPAPEPEVSAEPEGKDKDEAKELSAIHEVRITSFDEKQTYRLTRIAEARADLRQAEIISMLKRKSFVAAFTNEEKARRCVNALRAVKGTSVAVVTKEFEKSSK